MNRRSSPEVSAFWARAEGRVQGVGFRYHSMLEGRRLGLSGWVKNLPGGAVEVWAEGPRAKLDTFLEWLRHGPPGASVDFLRADTGVPAKNYSTFSITE